MVIKVKCFDELLLPLNNFIQETQNIAFYQPTVRRQTKPESLVERYFTGHACLV